MDPERPEEVRLFTVTDLVRIGAEVVQTLALRNMMPTPGCCTQGCCDASIIEMIGRPPDRPTIG
jgi:hypothetical protein